MVGKIDVKFSIDDLAKEPNQTAHWDGVRNYQARNIMRDEMKLGDMGLFYHSNCKIPGIIGTVEIVKEGYPDHTAFDSKDPHYDPKSDKKAPKWFMVDVKLREKFHKLISLDELKKYSTTTLSKMELFTQKRLSVSRVSSSEFHFIVDIARKFKK